MKLLSDTWLLFKYNVKTTVRNPAWSIIGLFQPVVYLLLFAPLLTGIADAPGFSSERALNTFTPGLLVMMGILGTSFVGFGLIADLRNGLIERLRVTPVSRLALLLGRALRDVAILLVQCLLLVLVASPFGLEISFTGLILTLMLLVLIGIIVSSCCYALALLLRDENAYAPLMNTIILPLLLLSGILLPLDLAPRWLQVVASVNPFSHAVESARTLMNGDLTDGSVVFSFTLMVPLAGLALWWAASSFRRGIA